MFTGELDYTDIPMQHWLGQLLFLIFIFLIVVVIMNLLNGLAVSDIQKIYKVGKSLLYHSGTDFQYNFLSGSGHLLSHQHSGDPGILPVCPDAGTGNKNSPKYQTWEFSTVWSWYSWGKEILGIVRLILIIHVLEQNVSRLSPRVRRSFISMRTQWRLQRNWSLTDRRRATRTRPRPLSRLSDRMWRTSRSSKPSCMAGWRTWRRNLI